jgi:hypothetical protein
MGQATGTIAQGMFRGLGAGFGQLGQGLLNPNMRLADPSARMRLAAAGSDTDSSGSSGSSGSGMVQEALSGGASIFPEALSAVNMAASSSSSSSGADGKQTRTLMAFDPVAAAGAAGDMVVASSTMQQQQHSSRGGSSDGAGSSAGSSDGSSGGSGSRSLQQVDFFAGPMALNNFVNEGVTSGAFGTQLGGDLSGQIQTGLAALAGTGTGIGADALAGTNALTGGSSGGNALGQLARLAGLGGLGGNAADPFNAGGANPLGGIGSLLSNVVGGSSSSSSGSSSGKKKGLGGFISGLAHRVGGRGSGSSSTGDASDAAVGAASLSGVQSASGTDGSTMYSPYGQQQYGQQYGQQQGAAQYIMEQGTLGPAAAGLAQQGLTALQGQQQQQQQRPSPGQPGSSFMGPDQYSQAFQQLTKIPGQAAGALTGYGLGLANQGLQTTQNLGNQIFNQAGQNLADGNPVVGGNSQPLVVPGLGQDPNTYVIGGSDYYPGGNGQGQVQQFNQVPAGPSSLVSGQMTPATNQRNQFGGGQLGTGGQFVTQPTQPAGVLDPSTGGLFLCKGFRVASIVLQGMRIRS